MKLFGTLLTAVVVLAAAQAAMAVLAALLLGWFIWGLLTYPREMIGLIGLLGLVGVFLAQPLACLGLVAAMIIAKLILRY